MAETKHQEEVALHSKRKPDLSLEDNEENPKKGQKLESLNDANDDSSFPREKNQSVYASERSASVAEEKDGKLEADLVAEADAEEEEEEYDDEDEDEDDDDDDDDDDEDDENGNGEAQPDRKGKGIAKDAKGKGKLIAEEEDNDDDSDNGSDASDAESDLSDDPLAEVDLDNILPSRTRRRTVQPGVYIANDLGNDDEDSDDSDA